MRTALRRRRARLAADYLQGLALAHCDRFEALIAAGREEAALAEVEVAGLLLELAEAVRP